MKQVIRKPAGLQLFGEAIVQGHAHGLKPEDLVHRMFP